MSYAPQQPPPAQTPPPGATLPEGRAPRNTFGLVALIVGIVAFVTAFVPIVNYAAVFLALAGLVLGVIALFFPARKKGTAIAGLIISFVALIVSIVLAIVYTFLFFGHVINSATGSGAGDDPLDDGEVSLIYQVDGTGSDVDITYATFENGVPGTEQETGQRLPFEQEFEVPFGGAATYNTYTITAVNGPGDGDVICRIVVDGRVLVEREATGEYSAVTCTASGTDLLE